VNHGSTKFKFKTVLQNLPNTAWCVLNHRLSTGERPILISPAFQNIPSNKNSEIDSGFLFSQSPIVAANTFHPGQFTAQMGTRGGYSLIPTTCLGSFSPKASHPGGCALFCMHY
jgi:hypothetical protein